MCLYVIYTCIYIGVKCVKYTLKKYTACVNVIEKLNEMIMFID